MERFTDPTHPVPGIFAMPTSSATLMALFVCSVPSCGTDAELDPFQPDVPQSSTTGRLELQVDDRPDTLDAERVRQVAEHEEPNHLDEVRRLDRRVDEAVDRLSRDGRLIRRDLADRLSRARMDVQRAASEFAELGEKPTEQAQDGFDEAIRDFEHQVERLELLERGRSEPA